MGKPITITTDEKESGKLVIGRGISSARNLASCEVREVLTKARDGFFFFLAI